MIKLEILKLKNDPTHRRLPIISLLHRHFLASHGTFSISHLDQEMILKDPQYLSRSILRSEIHMDTQEETREIERILFPRYGIDEAPLKQKVIFDPKKPKMCV
jgi:hypothetical protein